MTRITLFALLLVLLFACSKAGDCGSAARIDQILPGNALPAGNAFIIRGSGFDAAASVRMGKLELAPLVDLTLFDGKPKISIPQGLLLSRAPETISGPTELSIESGDCIARAEVEVLSAALVSGSPAGIPFFFVPPLAPAFPSSFSNEWKDLADPDHSLSIQGPANADGSGSVDPNFGASELHNNIDTLGFFSNPITGYIQPPGVFLVIDRSNLNVVVKKDTLIGRYVDPETVDPKAKDAIWLISINTGTQLVIAKYQ